MIKVLFLCHGNICRSPMAEFIFKDIVKKAHLENNFVIDSKALTYEEEGNPLYYRTVETLEKYHIPYEQHIARKIQYSDVDKYDYIFYMDEENAYYVNKYFSNKREKFYKLTDFVSLKGDVSDPWYTGKFDDVYNELTIILNKLLKKLK